MLYERRISYSSFSEAVSGWNRNVFVGKKSKINGLLDFMEKPRSTLSDEISSDKIFVGQDISSDKIFNT